MTNFYLRGSLTLKTVQLVRNNLFESIAEKTVLPGVYLAENSIMFAPLGRVRMTPSPQAYNSVHFRPGRRSHEACRLRGNRRRTARCARPLPRCWRARGERARIPAPDLRRRTRGPAPRGPHPDRIRGARGPRLPSHSSPEGRAVRGRSPARPLDTRQGHAGAQFSQPALTSR